VSVRLWRLLVALTAVSGVVLAAQRYDVWWTALSQLANLAVATGFLLLAFREPRSPWLRGALASVMLLVALAYLPMANGNLTQPWSVLEHVVTPTLVVLDFLVRGDNQHRVRWWHPLSWLVAPAAYLAWYVASDLAVYDALDPARPGVFGAQVAVLLAVLLASGYACYGFGARQRRYVPSGAR
jgi:hypothetical protein